MTPPKAAQRLLLWFLKDEIAEEVSGDLDEKFHIELKTKSAFKAKLNYWYQVFNYLRPFAIRSLHNVSLNHYAMFENYFKTSWRSMSRQKMYAAIKIGGFALGLATCMIIALFIRNELNHDNYYKEQKNIYRVYNDLSQGADADKWVSFPAMVAQLIKTSYPEVDKAGRIISHKWFNAGSNLVRRDDQVENTYEEKFAYIDPEVLDILEVPMIYGNRDNALTQPNSIVISKRKADRYFPNQDPTGKIFILNDDKSTPFIVGGVMENFPASSHLDIDFLITLSQKEFWQGEQTSWCCWNYTVYVRLIDGTDPRALEQKLSSVKQGYVDYLVKTENQSLSEVKKYYSIKLQPIEEIYLKSEGIYDHHAHGDLRYIWMFGGVACFILLLACINFINLSTAKSANRAKEVGLRKVVGSVRRSIVGQFLIEALLYSIISFVLAVVIVSVTLPFFTVLSGKSLEMPWSQWWVIPSLLTAAIIIGSIAGVYPAFYLSAFKPVDVLKGAVSRGSKSSGLRNAMVVFQFTTSIVLIIGTLVIYRQMNYIMTTKIGYDKNQVVMIHGANTLNEQQQTFKDELLRLSGVKNATASSYFPVDGTQRDQNPFWKEGKSKEDKSVGAQKWYVDEDYITTMGMKLVEGRNFNKQIASDSQVVIINQAMAKALGLSKPIGEKIMNWEVYTVIGVVEDFHFESLKGDVSPLCFVLGSGGSIVAARVNGEKMDDVIASLTKTWKRFMPHQPLRYTFLDESYALMYEDVQRTGYILTSFAVLAVIVACLGLFGLSAFIVEQRSKEISIRIVLGASIKNIFNLLTSNFIKLVLISFVIASPIAWYVMNEWLADYKNRTDITADIFVIAAIASILIALMTISYQSLRAAMTNPVNNLKNE